MAKRELVWEIDHYDDEDETYLRFRDETSSDDVRTEPVPTLEELADFCDNRCENRNYHDFVGSHRALAVILIRSVGREKATEIMRTVAEYDSLDTLAQRGPKELGFPDCWADWEAK